MNTALHEELMAFPTREERVQAISDDLQSGNNKYAAIDPWVLAEDILGIPLVDGSLRWERASVAPRITLDYFTDPTPIADHIELIFDLVDPHRVTEWKQQIEAIISGAQKEDIAIDDDERDMLEIEMTKEFIRDGSGWDIYTVSLKGSKDGEILLQACDHILK